MEHFEIEDSKERDEQAPLDPTTKQTLPLEFVTKGMKPSVLRRRARLVILIIPIVFLATSCLFSGFQVYWTHLFNKSNPYTGLSAILYRLQDTNCNFRMITDIQIVSHDQSCVGEANYLEDVGVWNGTIEGCYYPESGRMNVRDCPTNAEFTVPAHPPIRVYNWRGSRFCTRMTSSYKDFSSTGGAGHRSSKLCKAEPQNFYIRSDEECPISDLKIISANQNTPVGYKERRLVDGRKLIFANEVDNAARLVDLNNELNSRPCLDPLISPRRRREPYPYSRKLEVGCKEYGVDDDTFILDFEDALEFYKENSLEPIQSDLPKWIDYNYGEQIALYAKYRTRVLSREQCDFCSSGRTLYASAQELSASSRYMDVYVIVTAVILIFQLFLVVYNLMKYVEHGTDYGAMFEDVMAINMVFYISNAVYFGIHAWLAYSDYAALQHATDRISEIEVLDCFVSLDLNRAFDDIRGKVLDNSKDIMQDCLKAEIIAIFCSIIFILASYINRNLSKSTPQQVAEESEALKRVNSGEGYTSSQIADVKQHEQDKEKSQEQAQSTSTQAQQ